ncbi:hypothetical protein BKA62DRAFT_835369 [Auriculariales sp. MPI-PUGE-AT-0066]|nr:hypothetical protein BKA62DRAFT_835369 [Auriculariales sp. MPI-PUGE-AT-0066]
MAAETIERPTYFEWPDQVSACTFVVFTVDPVSSVSALRDPEATRQARELPRNKYLAIVDSVRNDATTWRVPPLHPPTGLSFLMVGRGLPTSLPPSACTPLFAPNAHPDGRAHIQPQLPLPWPDCYVYSTGWQNGRVDRLHLSDPAHINRIDFSQLGKLLSNNAADMRIGLPPGPPTESDDTSENHSLREESAASVHEDGEAATHGNDERRSQAGSRPISEHSSDHDDGSSGLLDFVLASAGIKVPDDGKPADADDAGSMSSHSSQSTAIIGIEPVKSRTRVEVWTDLTTATDIASPEELISLRSRLKEIEIESLARQAVVNAPGATNNAAQQWAEGVADAGADAPAPENDLLPGLLRPPLQPASRPASPSASHKNADLEAAAVKPTEPEKKSKFSQVGTTARRLATDVLTVARRVLARLATLNPFRRKAPTTASDVAVEAASTPPQP